jgi:hypothetical protein
MSLNMVASPRDIIRWPQFFTADSIRVELHQIRRNRFRTLAKN